STLGRISMEEFFHSGGTAHDKDSTVSLLEYDFRPQALRLVDGDTLAQDILDALQTGLSKPPPPPGLVLKNHLALIGKALDGQMARVLVLSDRKLALFLAELHKHEALSGAEFR